MNATDRLTEIVDANLSGGRTGVYSVCSSEPRVLKAAMLQALSDDSISCIESTCNQVNQFGGYARMTPAEFRGRVSHIAGEVGLAVDRVVIGGDHLGPWPWRQETAASAMDKAADLVRSCVAAGYTKIHLDASMRCSDDGGSGPLDEAAAIERTVVLCRAAEDARAGLAGDSPAPYYVIGTEVPIPGGEQVGDGAPAATPAEDVARVIERTQAAFVASGLDSAWERVIAVVTQPGVEFGDANVFPYERDAAEHLPRYLEGSGRHIVFEAHSTDYQTEAALQEMVEDHFAILKVGPGLTFAMREALFALEAIERRVLGEANPSLSRLPEVLDTAMVADPQHWRDHYAGDEQVVRVARAFSYSDRCRYYWPQPEVQESLSQLFANLRAVTVPPTLVSQFLPDAYEAMRRGGIGTDPEELVLHRIMAVTGRYARACGDSPKD